VASQIVRETNRKVVAIPADLTKPADAAAFVEESHAALGRVDVWSIMRDRHPVEFSNF
jgi:NAD(P)-dependent dehydrogenase (short-subunit alcohol dehydrogenase family)